MYVFALIHNSPVGFKRLSRPLEMSLHLKPWFKSSDILKVSGTGVERETWDGFLFQSCGTGGATMLERKTRPLFHFGEADMTAVFNVFSQEDEAIYRDLLAL